MALFEQFPYTNFHGVNLAWILESVNAANERLDADETRLSAAEASISNFGPRITKNSQDIGTITSLETTDKTSLVAAINELVDSGGYAPATSYISLSDKPQINGVTLSGNKTTANLNVSYNDLTNRPQINGVTLTGNKTTANLNVSYADLTTKPSINGVTLSGDKTTADLGVSYADLTDKPIAESYNLVISPNTSKTITFNSGRVAILVIGVCNAQHTFVCSIWQAYNANNSHAIDLSTDNNYFTFTALTGGAYGVTIASTNTSTFEGRVLVLQGSIASIA